MPSPATSTSTRRARAPPACASRWPGWPARAWPHELDPESEVTITSGATEAVFAAMQALLDPGDEVIVFDPAYESYGPAITYPGGVPVPVPLHAPDRATPAGGSTTMSCAGPLVRAPVSCCSTRRTTRPARCSRADELDRLAAVCIERDLVAVTDEVYEYLTFGVQHVSLASLPGMWERTLTISSSAKTFSLTGWKIGWALGPADLVRGLRAAHQSMVFCAPAPLQEGIAAGLAQAEARGYYRQLQAEYQERRDYLLTCPGSPPVCPRCPAKAATLPSATSAGWVTRTTMPSAATSPSPRASPRFRPAPSTRHSTATWDCRWPASPSASAWTRWRRPPAAWRAGAPAGELLHRRQAAADRPSAAAGDAAGLRDPARWRRATPPPCSTAPISRPSSWRGSAPTGASMSHCPCSTSSGWETCSAATWAAPSSTAAPPSGSSPSGSRPRWS